MSKTIIFGIDQMNQLANAMVEAGFTPALVSKLGQSPDTLVALKEELSGSTKPATQKIIGGLLQIVGEPVKFAAVEQFVVAEEFVIGTDREFSVSYLCPNFSRQLLPLFETKVPGVTLRKRELLKSSVDTLIIKAVGGEKKALTCMAHVKRFLQTADRPQWYLFYVRDCFGVVCAFYAAWRARGWGLNVSSVSDPNPWYAGYVVVTR